MFLKNKNLPSPEEKSLEKEGTHKEKGTSALLSRAGPGREYQQHREILHPNVFSMTRGAKLVDGTRPQASPLEDVQFSVK